MASSTTTPPTHVPAWKRLGLKLKHHPDNNTSSTASAPTAASAVQPSSPPASEKKKRKRDASTYPDNNSPAEASAKKHKKDSKSDKKEKKKSKKEKKRSTTNDGEEDPAITKSDKKSKKSKSTTMSTTADAPPPAQSTPEPLILSQKEPKPTRPQMPTSPAVKSALKTASLSRSPEPTPAPPLTRRKSVTFTSDTKTVDGDSIKNLYLALDPFGKNEKNGKDASRYVHAAPSSYASESDSSASGGAGAKKIVKKVKDKDAVRKRRQERRAAEAASRAGVGERKELAYLATFHGAREEWKFSKPMQNWVLKHALDVDAVGDKYEEALFAYLAGLKGDGARQRVRAEAGKVVNEVEGKEEKAEGDAERVKRARCVLGALEGKKVLEREDEDADAEESSSEESSSDDSSSDESSAEE